jgi:hypothetical protein
MSGRILSHNSTILNTTIGAATSTIPIDTRMMQHISFQITSTVNATAKTADTAIKSLLEIQDLTYTAAVAGVAGDDITIEYVDGVLDVAVVGNAITVTLATGVTTATQVKAAYDAVPAAVALAACSITGTGGTAQTAPVAEAPLAGGVDSEFDITTNIISIPSHGFFKGQVVQATKTGAAFPTGIVASTNYYVFPISADYIALYDTLAHALAAANNGIGQLVDSTGVIEITADGSADSVITFTPVSLSGASWKIQRSNNYDPILETGNWVDLASHTGNLTTSASVIDEQVDSTTAWSKVVFAVSAGTLVVQVSVNAASV